MAQALRHITTRFREYNKDPIDGFYVEPTDDIFKWKFTLLGMHDTPFEGELLNGLIIFTTAFPNEPPIFNLRQISIILILVQMVKYVCQFFMDQQLKIFMIVQKNVGYLFTLFNLSY